MEFYRATMASTETLAGGKSDYADIVIIGNGIAGMTAAIEARRLAPELSISIFTDMAHSTINTPALKQFILGALMPKDILSYPSGIELETRLSVFHAHVERIYASRKEIQLSDGHSYGYGALLIATGSQVTKVPSLFPGSDLDGVMTLHSLHNYLDLSRRLQASKTDKIKSVVVVGGGVHACETVMNLLQRRLDVHWLIRGDAVYTKKLDQYASSLLLMHIKDAGATIHMHTEVAGAVGKHGSVNGVITRTNAFIPCQLVILCIGTQPAMELARDIDCPLATSAGIIVDDHLRTSVPGIYAAGDIAAVWDPAANAYEPRAQWAAAIHQGQIAGATMVGNGERIKNSLGIPWHSTKVGDYSLLTVGSPLLQEGAQSRMSMVDGTYRRVTTVGTRLVGYLSLGTEAMNGVGIKSLIDEGLESQAMIQALLKGTLDPQSYTKLYHTARLLTKSQPLGQEVIPAVTVEQIAKKAHSSSRLTQPLVEKVGKISTTSFYITKEQIAKEVNACIGCSECLFACPAVAEPLTMDVLNNETLNGPQSKPVIRFAQSCFQCGACVPVCPVGLHRDAMMMWLKVRLSQAEQGQGMQRRAKQIELSKEVLHAAQHG